ncbi:MAG: hypothetical protein A3J12_05930 [Omnitrophica bacterium RIFCSPLOWO2_02_FULL_44_11]|nr:MAG: hypothetical protein A3J12_05930 [Omnitrophica bacterium RIFCSPLOWO2_02_FULL_44_11]
MFSFAFFLGGLICSFHGFLIFPSHSSIFKLFLVDYSSKISQVKKAKKILFLARLLRNALQN